MFELLKHKITIMFTNNKTQERSGNKISFNL